MSAANAAAVMLVFISIKIQKVIRQRMPIPDSAELSFAEFAKRSFLARPWVTDAIFSMAPLDNVSRAAAFDDVPRDTAGEWTLLASEPDIDPDSLVDELVASWRRRSAS